ncbi:MAG: PH domain-containing protein [Ruminococcus sp.]|nr:PH domain-containing protein [Ruminococcus sp.]
MRHFYPDKKSMDILQIITAIVGFVIYMVTNYFVQKEKIILICGFFILSICAVIIFIHLPMYFANLEYTATDKEIIRKSGAIFKKHQSIRYSSIQYTLVIRTFLSGYTGFNFIIFFVFGGRCSLMFLSQKDTDEILKLSGSIYGGEK